MTSVRRVLERLRLWRRRDDALEAEIEAHLALLADDYVRSGLSPEAARAAARRAFGGVIQVKEAHREQRGWPAGASAIADVRHGLRALRRTPGFTGTAMLTLALGVAANAAIFGLADALLFRPLPVKDADRLTVFARERKDGTTLTAFLPGELDRLRSAQHWSALLGVAPATYDFVADGSTDRIQTLFVTGNYWEELGLRPALGTLFGEAGPNDAVIVLSHEYWKSRFAGDPGVIGRTVSLGGHPLTIVGVGPEGFRGDILLADTKGFVPMRAPGFRADRRPSRVIGVLKPGVSLRQANASLEPLSQAIALDRHESPDDVRIAAFWERLSRPNPHAARPEILSTLFFGILALLVLALACVNVGSLILIRTESRSRELAIRTALGATRARLAWHLFVETLLLVVASGTAGLALGQGVTIAIGRSLPSALEPFARQLAFDFNWRVAGFLGAVIGTTAIGVGLLPALRAGRAAVLRAGSAVTVTTRTPVRRALMTAQIAGALMLLIVAGLFSRSLGSIRAASFGFERGGVYDFSMNPSEAGIAGPAAMQRLEAILARIAAVPGVEAAALAQSVPMTSLGYSVGQVHAAAPAVDAKLEDVGYSAVSPTYFTTLRIPVSRGRSFTATDVSTAPRVAVVNQAMADRYWSGRDPIGQVFRIGRHDAPPVQVVGVAGNILNYSPMQGAAVPFFYLPLAQHPTPSVTLQVRSSRPPASVFRDVQAAMREAAPEVLPFRIETMAQAIDDAPDGLLFPRIGARLSSAFGALGLLLAGVGVYGVVAYAASRRTREFALRIALGASPRDVRQTVLMSGAGIVLGGLAAGLVLATLIATLTANLYFGVDPFDRVTFVTGTLVVGVAAFCACYVPARWAMRVNPIDALKDT